MEVLLEMERKAELEESELLLNKFSVKVSSFGFITKYLYLGIRKEGFSTV
jgi:hypothetical protein